MNYSFDIEIAKQIGVNEAIMYQNILFWICKNKAEGRHFYDGRYWTFNSVRAFQELFPFWSLKQTRTVLDSLVKQGILMKGNYNKTVYDRTCWYAFVNEPDDLKKITAKKTDEEDDKTANADTENDNSNSQNRQVKVSEMTNRNALEGEPIPDINTNINTNINTDTSVSPKKFENYENLEQVYDAETGLYKNLTEHERRKLEKQKAEQEYSDFENAIIVNFHKLKGQAISELRQIRDFKTQEQRLLLKASFESRKNRNWQQAIDKAFEKAYDEPAEYRWYRFINFVYLYLADADKRQKPKKHFNEMSETAKHNFLVKILENELTEPRLDWISYTEKTLMYQMNENNEPIGENHFFENDEFAWRVFNRYNELYKQYQNA